MIHGMRAGVGGGGVGRCLRLSMTEIKTDADTATDTKTDTAAETDTEIDIDTDTYINIMPRIRRCFACYYFCWGGEGQHSSQLNERSLNDDMCGCTFA